MTRLRSLALLLALSLGGAPGAGCDATETNVVPAPCTPEPDDCDGDLECESLETQDGPSEPKCVEPAECGDLVCPSGRCASFPGEDEVLCVVDPADAGA